MNEPLLIFDRAMLGHDPGRHHPESPERLRALEGALARDSTLGSIELEASSEASAEVIERVHTTEHVQRLLSFRDEEVALDPDTHVSPGSIRAALLAAGAATTAVDAVCTGDSPSAFAFVRPPGHHAESGRAMGFCLFNNVALAAAHARAVHGLERVMIIDWDVHHGNGTQEIFEHDRSVLFCSLHQSPHYPGTGAVRECGSGEGAGYTVNIPMTAGSGDADYALAFDALVDPIADQFRPELVLVSAGFDAHRLDPLGGMQISDDGFAELCGRALAIAQRSAHGRLALLLEGGYDLDGLAGGAVSCGRVLTGETPPKCGAETTNNGEHAVSQAIAAHRGNWKFT